MQSIKAHFDGQAVILDEPAKLLVGQAVRVIVEPVADDAINAALEPVGPWAGKFRVIRESDDIVADDFKDYLP